MMHSLYPRLDRQTDTLKLHQTFMTIVAKPENTEKYLTSSATKHQLLRIKFEKKIFKHKMKDSYTLGYLLNMCWQARSHSHKSIIVMEQDVGSAVRKVSSMGSG